MSTVLFDWGNKYVKVWVLRNKEMHSLDGSIQLKSIRCHIWMNEHGDHYIGEYDEAKENVTSHERFICSVESLKSIVFQQDVMLYISNVLVKKASSLLRQIIQIFFDEVINAVFDAAKIDTIDKILFLIPNSLSKDETDYLSIISTSLPMTFITKSEIAAYTHGIEKFGSDEMFIVIDLGQTHTDFILAQKTREGSIIQIIVECCNVGGQYIDILIYNFVISSNPDANLTTTERESLMKECDKIKKKIATGPTMMKYKYGSSTCRFKLESDVGEKLLKPYVLRVISFLKKNIRAVDLNEIRHVFLKGNLCNIVKIQAELKMIFGERLCLNHLKYDRQSGRESILNKFN